MSKLVSIIIVNWNGKEHLQKCLPSVFGQEYKKIEVILIDNASVDGSVEYAKSNFPKTRIIVNKKNLGFAQANNIGYEVARGEYILFLNNDTKVKKSFLVNLVKAIEGDISIGCVQSKILLMDEPKRFDSVGSFFNITGFLYHYGTYKKDSTRYNKQIDLFSARGACMMFKKSVLEKVKVGGEIFDRRYFAYFEETDLCHRVWLLGFRTVFIPNSVIYHKLGATSARLANEFVQYNSYKNRINSYIKNLGGQYLLKVLTIHLFFCGVVSFLYLLRGKLGVAFAIIRAVVWNVANIKKTLQYRHITQKHIRKFPDQTFLPSISKNASLRYYSFVFFGDLRKYVE